MPIRILHLSDLHFDDTIDVAAALHPLAQDIRSRDGLGCDRVDYVVISGDLTQKATPCEFAKAVEFVEDLLDRVQCQTKNCVIVPGNHDLTCDSEKYYELSQSVDRPQTDPAHLVEDERICVVRNAQYYPHRFRNFSTHFFMPLFNFEYPLDPQKQGISVLHEDSRIQFLAFNSSVEIDKYYRNRSK